jgi:hypothetical protein
MKYSTSNSGAYIMRTTGPAAAYAPGNTRVTVIRGKLVQQSISTISGRSLVMTVFDDSNVPAVMEQRWTVSADPNEEVVTRYETDIETNNVWYTDNGMHCSLYLSGPEIKSDSVNQQASRWFRVSCERMTRPHTKITTLPYLQLLSKTNTNSLRCDTFVADLQYATYSL